MKRSAEDRVDIVANAITAVLFALFILLGTIIMRELRSAKTPFVLDLVRNTIIFVVVFAIYEYFGKKK